MENSESSHDFILRRISTKWIDIFPGRNGIPPEELPPYAHDISSCFLIEIKQNERLPEDAGVSFIEQMRTDPEYSLMQVPGEFAWLAVDGNGTRYAIVHWSNWNGNTIPLCQEFANLTGRSLGTLLPDGTVLFPDRQVPFCSIELIHEDHLKPKAATVYKKTAAGKKVIETAHKLLAAKKPSVKELEAESFNDDTAAHDDDLQTRLSQKFIKRFEAYRKELTRAFGNPVETGEEPSDGGTVRGVFAYAVWKREQRRLVLPAGHEDRELPYAIVLAAEVASA